MASTAIAARRDLYRLIEEVNLDCDEIKITSTSGCAFLVSSREYNSLRETAHLLRFPVNAARLAASAQQFHEGRATPRDLVETDEERAQRSSSPSPTTAGTTTNIGSRTTKRSLSE